VRISIYTVLLFVLGLSVIALAAGAVNSALNTGGGEISDTGDDVNQGFDCVFENPENPDQNCDVSYNSTEVEIYEV
jgi:hypothetical protein